MPSSNVFFGLLGGLVLLAFAGAGLFLWGNEGDVEYVAGETPIEEKTEEKSTLPSISLASTTITLPDGSDAQIQLPKEFELVVAADELGKARFMAMSPDGRMFLPDMVNYKLSHQGKLFVLGDFDKETGTFKTKHTYLSGLRGPNSVAFYKDKDGQDWLYVAITEKLVRYRYKAGDVKPSSPPETIFDFPNKQSSGEVSVVWHITRTIVFHKDRIYIAVGSGCNSCEELAGSRRAMIYSIKPDGSDFQVYADRLRNTVGLTWAGDVLYATANGADHLGPGLPDELMYKIEEGDVFSWPYCYESKGTLYPDTTQTWNTEIDCEKEKKSLAAFEAHSAPLGIQYFEDAHPILKDTFLVALHGSFDIKIGAGNRIMRVTKEGKQEIFMDGFLTEDGRRVIRPVHFLQYDKNSLFFTDDQNGRVYLVRAKS